MYVIVYCNEGPDSGLVYLTRELEDDELLVTRTFADEVANMLDSDIAPNTGHIGNSAGHLRVEFTDHKPNVINERYQGSTRIWSGESYYFASEDDHSGCTSPCGLVGCPPGSEVV